LFFTDSGWWKAAENLKVGDKILDSKGELKTLIGKSVEALQVPERIYNFNVAEFHTYFVGTNGLLVHNDCTADMISAAREAIANAKALIITDTKILEELGSSVADFVKRFKISDPNELSRIAQEAAEAVKTKVYREVDLVDANGLNLGEFDVVDVPKRLFIEDKSAIGLSNPLNTQTPIDWATKQILDKTTTRIQNLAKTVATRPKIDGTAVVPEFSEISSFKEFLFRVDADTPDLRQAVETVLTQLRSQNPNYTFNAIFGG
jgi:hypothetical protein